MVARQWQKSRTVGEAFWHAWEGVRWAAKQEKNFRIQIAVYGLALALGAVLGLPARDMALIVLSAAVILGLEMVNTAVETLADAVDAHYHERLRLVKDLAAGAVLVASAAAVAVGLLLFGPALVY